MLLCVVLLCSDVADLTGLLVCLVKCLFSVVPSFTPLLEGSEKFDPAHIILQLLWEMSLKNTTTRQLLCSVSVEEEAVEKKSVVIIIPH